MKRLVTLAVILVPLLSMAQDDLYFTSSKKAKEAAQKRAASSMNARTQTVVAPTVVYYNSNTRSEDEYNRRYVYSGDFQMLVEHIWTTHLQHVSTRLDWTTHNRGTI